MAPAIAPGGASATARGRTDAEPMLVGTGTLAAGTIDFLGDTLGSFSSLKVAPGSWRRVGDHYEGTLWTLPDRGRNDPEEGIFFDYPARLERLGIRFTPADGRVELIPQGGLELRDFNAAPFTSADPGTGLVRQRGIVLPAPASGTGAGKVALDAESLQFARDGSLYVGDEYSANIYHFDPDGHLRGVIRPPASVEPRRDGQPAFGSLQSPDTGRRNNQGPEGMSLSPDGRTLFVILQSALMQDSATGNAAGRINTRILVYDVGRTPTPARPVAHYVVQLPAYDDRGHGGAPNRTAAQSEIRALDDHRLLMLARDGAGRGAGDDKPMVYKQILLVDIANATNLAGTAYDTGTASLLASPRGTGLRPGIRAADTVPFIDMLDQRQLARVGLTTHDLSEKWEAMDIVPALDPDHPDDHFLLVGNDNDFIARHCRMSGRPCDADIDNDNRILVYRIGLPPVR